MRILVAPDAFKGSLRAPAVAKAIAAGLRRALPDATLDLQPLGDGGQGTLDALAATGHARILPLERPITRADRTLAPARLGLLDDALWIESADAIGWSDGHTTLDPTTATSHGVGELLRAALARDQPRRIVIGLGGSRTIDGGLGLLQALGAHVCDARGVPLPPGAPLLLEATTVDLEPVANLLGDRELVAACDVTSPLLGPLGARRFMAQKGARDPALQHALERGLARMLDATGHPEVATRPGAGAAGGLGAALALLGARLTLGIDAMIEVFDLATRVSRAAVVVSGEGRVDGQSQAGKVLSGLARLCRSADVPLVALCGSYAPQELEATCHALGLRAAIPIVPGPMTLDDASANTAELLETTAWQLARLLEPRRRHAAP